MITFKSPNTEVKSFYLEGEPPRKDAYRLILDFYPKGSPTASPGTKVPVITAETVKPAPALAPAEKPEKVVKKAEPPEKPAVAVKEEVPPAKKEAPVEEPREAPSAVESFLTHLSGEASIIARPIRSGDDDSAKFTEYRDFNIVTGEWDVKYEKKDEYFFQTDAKNVGQDDQYYNFMLNRYGKFKTGASYDEIPHRFAFDAKTLYSGVGSGNLTLNDQLQTDLQNGVITIDQAFNNAVSGDPEFKRKKAKLNFEWVALDPFSFKVDLGYEKQDGTRPFFGSFGLTNTVEIFEPIDNRTLEMKLIAEYAKNPYFFNATYYYQNFENNEDTLTWDNPFRITDAFGEPAKGLIDLAPDNYYQSISLSGSYTNLPFGSRISANASWGWMRQNDDLVPFTTNTALVAPINYSDPSTLPQDDADAKVNTSLYNVSLLARPLDYMRVKGNFRYYDYDNETDKIVFPNGYVNADSTPRLSQIQTLPSSYDKTKADVDLGFDVMTRTRLNLDYTYDRTKRTNREVDRQEDHIFGGSIDTRPFSWSDFRASYKRTERDISNYDFAVYNKSGEDLDQLPGLRKYTQADVSRDRVQFLANVYPIEPLAFSGSFTYGRDDFNDSDFGLTDDHHYILTFDADYAIMDRLHLHAFYNYERYEYEQKGQGEFNGPPVINWKAQGNDKINTIGGGVKFAVIPDRLDFDISYSYSDVDGEIDFDIPGGGVVDWDTVDETQLHILDTKLISRIWGGFFLTLGYLYEKFDYDDFNTEGFTNTPTDAILAGTLPEDYTAHIFYTKLTYKFDFDSDSDSD
jgi:MtrB/PioB family decaheme-associated outer membrane protein